MAVEIIETGKSNKATVWFADGTYSVSEPLVIDPLKSQVTNSQIIFKAEKNSRPVISGGIQITGWIESENGLWEAELPIELKGQNNFRELFIDGKRATRARFPDSGYLRIAKAGADRRTNFYYTQGDFPIPENPENVEVILLHDWSVSRIGVKTIDIAENRIFAVDSIGAKDPAFFNIDNWEPNPRYFLENAMEFLDADYEWVYLKETNQLLLKLPENTIPENHHIVVPVSEGLIQLRGTENQTVKNITFEGITFQYCKWNIPAKGYCGVQACHFDPRPERQGWSVVPAAVHVVWGDNILFKSCVFRNFGGSGLWFDTGSRNCVVSESEFEDISGNGIMIGEGQDRMVNGEQWWKSAPYQVAFKNTVENCEVKNCGRQFYGAVGVWCGLTAETTIKNNEISDLPYTGVSVGWMWSPVPTPCRQNIIEGNHIHHVLQELSDGGGIYMLGLQPGSKILNNLIHDVQINAGRAESNGMFLDEGTTDVMVANNVIYNIAKSPLRFHKATTNLVKDNYLFCADENPPIRYNRTEEEDIKKEGNKVFKEEDTNFQTELEKAILNWK